MDGSTAETAKRTGVHKRLARIARSAPELSVVARLAHLQCAVGNAAVLDILGNRPTAADEASGTPNPAP